MAELQPAPEGYPIKLVRDRTAAIINSTGKPGDLFYGPVPEEEDVLTWLIKKLGEEVMEYIVDGSQEELRDVLAVIDGICRFNGSSLLTEYDKMMKDKRGLFRDGVMMYGRHDEFDSEPMPR